MDLLVLGGTRFLSHRIAAEAVVRGHQVTCLARGRAGPVPDGTELVRADRDAPGAYDQVLRDWDAVVDVARQPGQVRAVTETLGQRTRHWTYVSSGSVYADHSRPGANERRPLLPAATGDTVSVEEYGEAKVACERVCREVLGDRLHTVRAGLIGGPGDESDRLGWWPARFALAAEGRRPVLVPVSDGGRTQVVDVRDLATWVLDAAERAVTGVHDAVGEQTPLADVLDQSAEVAGYHGERVHVPLRWLLEHGVQPWMGPDSLPLCLPATQEYAGFAARSGAAARAAGLRHRPVVETLADTLAHERTRGLDRDRGAGLSYATERRLLTDWSTR